MLVGDRDEYVSVELAAELCRARPDAELAILPNATHRTTLGERFTQIVLDFCLRHSQTA